MQCIHEDIQEYQTKMVTLGIGPQTFASRVNVVPWLDCGVLIGRDCPILVQLLRRAPQATCFSQEVLLQAKLVGVELHIQRPNLTQLIRDYLSPWFALAATREQPPPTTENTPQFPVDKEMLYRWVRASCK